MCAGCIASGAPEANSFSLVGSEMGTYQYKNEGKRIFLSYKGNIPFILKPSFQDALLQDKPVPQKIVFEQFLIFAFSLPNFSKVRKNNKRKNFSLVVCDPVRSVRQ